MSMEEPMDTKALEHALRTYRPAGAPPLPADFVWPRYEGLCVGNLAATVAQALGVALPDALPPLRADLVGDLLEGVERVVLLVVDALGWEQLRGEMRRHEAGGFHRLAQQGRLLPLTTTFISTTNSVLSTLWTGRPSVEHGLLAYSLYLREWLMAVEAIGFSAVHEPFANTLLTWGFQPEAFLPVPSMGQVFAAQGVPTYSVIADRYTETPLSLMHFRGVEEVAGHLTASDFWVTLRRMLAQHRGERMVLGGYWSAVDSLAHRWGPLDETGEAEIRSLSLLMDELFLRRLDPADREGTLLLLTADHGQITTNPASAVLLEEHPALQDALWMTPLGESRVPFFYVRQGRYDEVRAYLSANLTEQFLFLSQDEVLQSGLLGPGKPHPEVRHRLGDLVGLARGDAFLAHDEKDMRRLQGRHGGLSPQEMLVPLFAVRLDA